MKTQIQQCLQAFSGTDLRTAAIHLLNTLGYRSEKTLEIDNARGEFLAQFDNRDRKLRRDKALFGKWKNIDFLFQITDDEVRDAGMQGSLGFDSGYDPRNYQSYLFFALDLKQGQYTRTQLSDITREINLLFGMPAMLFIRHGGTLTLSVIDRRISKRDESRDVLEKVKLIKDIRCDAPHRAHIEILYDLSLPELMDKHACTNFLELHKAWRQTLDSDALNKRFYRELADWYFWALDHVRFPDDVEKDASTRNATNVIRLLTRLIFCWFLKEKGLLPPELFSKKKLQGVLKSMADDESTFYQAILQNLFFATLNQKMNTGGEINRKFAVDAGFKANKNEYGVKNLYRYQNLFAVSEAEAIKLFEDIPFLNGGLFDCLDKEDQAGKVQYVDGFTRNPRKQPDIPNFLFFSDYRTLDLSDAYGDKKKKREKVRGLINLLDSYKFTITENTPIEEEIALDPELLGKVFENLLASYNPETGTTARKQTGSFYTPREIVNYMVDESLIAYLEAQLKARVPKLANMEDLQSLLREVFAYTEKSHPFDEEEVNALIAAIDDCKILDPACGSGAFPMGILHKLVFILARLDPHNERWKQKQIEKAELIPDVSAREIAVRAIEKDFETNDLDYGRKLYLIENCIYGVDIQPIAIQISKLRFFISLICDQRTNKNKARNCGVRPLPNLETKFVAANTLISIDRGQGQLLLTDLRLTKLEEELATLRHKHFAAQSRRTKLAIQKKDAELRKQIAEILADGGMSSEASHQLATWNPYDQNKSAGFFDPEWMFGIVDGFHVVIGNPPYVLLQAGNRDNNAVARFRKQFRVASYKIDLYHLFIEQGILLLNPKGTLCYITPSNFVSNNYAVPLRHFLLTETHLSNLTFLDESVFDASVLNVIILAHRPVSQKVQLCFDHATISDNALILNRGIGVAQTEFIDDRCLLVPGLSQEGKPVLAKMESSGKRLGDFAEVRFGMQLRDRRKYPLDVLDGTEVEGCITQDHRPCYTGKDVHRFYVTYSGKKCYFNREAKRGGCWNEKLHVHRNKILVRQIGKYPEGGLDTLGYAVLNASFMIVPKVKDVDSKYLLGVLNSSATRFYWESKFKDDRRTFPKIKGEYLKALPVPSSDDKIQRKICELVNKIVLAKEYDSEANIEKYELAIDEQVNTLYGLTKNEIAIVESRE